MRPVSDTQRPQTPVSVRAVGVIVLALLAWLLFGSALSVVRALIALAGYIIVAFVAYSVGKWVGRRSVPD